MVRRGAWCDGNGGECPISKSALTELYTGAPTSVRRIIILCEQAAWRNFVKLSEIDIEVAGKALENPPRHGLRKQHSSEDRIAFELRCPVAQLLYPHAMFVKYAKNALYRQGTVQGA
jgi:hypothetical protein